MGLFTKIAGAFSTKSTESQTIAEELAALTRDGRLHARHVIHVPSHVTLSLDDGVVGQLRDVSFSGLGVAFPRDVKDRLPSTMTPIQGTLRVLDRVVRINLTPVHWIDREDNGTFIGIRVQHEVAATLLAVKELIEPLSWGASLRAVGHEVRNERYHGPGWSCFRGDGPTDVFVLATPDRTDLIEGQMTFRIGGQYHEVSLRQGHLATHQSHGHAEPGYGSSHMAGTGPVDLKTLRYAACVLLGAPDAARLATAPLLTRLGEALKATTTSGAA